MKKIIAVLLCVPAIVYADFWSGNTLYTRQTSTDVMDRVQSFGYVMGVYDVGVNLVFCPGNESNITVGQINDMVKNWLANNPQHRNQPAERLVLDVFRQVWPCANRSNRL
jgi:hypothetical protein